MADKPVLERCVPVFGIGGYQETIAHYVDWLGFKLDWEWRATPHSPAIVSVSRDRVSLMLNEATPENARSALTVQVTNLQSLVDEWNSRGKRKLEVVIGPPYDIPSVYVEDPFGNFMDFQQPVGAEEEARRSQRAEKMREFVRSELAAGRDCPSAEKLVLEMGPPVGVALDVLCEFPEYAEATRLNDES